MGVFGVPIATPRDAVNALAAGRALLAESRRGMKSAGVRGAGQFPSESASTMAKCSPASSKAESG
jgi:hypothetical protein